MIPCIDAKIMIDATIIIIIIVASFLEKHMCGYGVGYTVVFQRGLWLQL